ncbi:MAG: endonuclease III [Treponema sp.]|jgi:endonuclease-3|nr:endonuclease III [Treponema sp.]
MAAKKALPGQPSVQSAGDRSAAGSPGAGIPRWDTILAALEKWREDLRKERAASGDGASGGGKDPSVSTVAERYRRDPWAVLVSTILSLRTKDEVTLVTSRRLLEKAPSPAALRALPEETIARLAYPAGFYRTKAASLKKIAALLLDQYQGAVPSDMEALLALPGVGRKTANLVRIEAFDLPGLCVDIHVHRISNRAGWVSAKSPDETEAALRERLPKKYWKGINALLVLYGQNLCRPVSPFCSRCVIKKHCQRLGVESSR